MTAIISECGQYRYRLEREVQHEGKVFAFFGINPSTADDVIDDPTVKKWRGFMQRNGGRRFIVGNVFAFRSTDPKVLSTVEDPFGPDLPHHLRTIIAEADVLVPCWGRLMKMPRELRGAPAQLLDVLVNSGKPVLHFGVTACKQPMHPLMLGYSTPLLPWEGKVYE